MDGIINIYKEKGFTSHDVVAVIRKIIHQKKVGHTGTLDPEAEGVLPVCLGRGTKIADDIMAEKKGYRTVVALGVTTTTEDATGEIIEKKEFQYDENKISQAVNSFKGRYLQTPPMYSAIKQNGKKLYELAREGKTVERKPREVTIYDIQIVNFLPPYHVELDVVCGKGTYIRTLCVDIGTKLECGAHMKSLLRTRSGHFHLNDAVKLETVKKMAEENRLNEIVQPIDSVLKEYNKLVIAQKATKLLHNGCNIYDYFFVNASRPLLLDEKILVYDSAEKFVGIYQLREDNEKNNRYIKPLKVLL